jgi:uncharacterized protein (DUF2236 family)
MKSISAPGVDLQRELATPCLAGQPRQLGGHRKSRLEMTRSPERPATAVESEPYCAEASAIEDALGIPRGQLPRSFSELRRYMDAMYDSGQIAVTDVAKTLALAIVYPPAPALARPLLAPMRLTAIGLLPPTIREGYGFHWDGRAEATLRLSARLARHALPLLPGFARYWPAARHAVRRQRGQVGRGAGGEPRA